MIQLQVPDMSCAHCTGAITKAIRELDPDAKLSFDMTAHSVAIDTDEPLESVMSTLKDAGYPATPAS
jgi:copper chaperone